MSIQYTPIQHGHGHEHNDIFSLFRLFQADAQTFPFPTIVSRFTLVHSITTYCRLPRANTRMESPRRLLNVQLLLPQQKKLCVCRVQSAGTRREISFIITIHICVCIINTHFHLTLFSLCTINVWCCYRYRPRFRQHYHDRHIILIFFCVLPGLWGSYCFLIPCCGHCRLCCAMLAEWSILCAIPCLYVCTMNVLRMSCIVCAFVYVCI